MFMFADSNIVVSLYYHIVASLCPIPSDVLAKMPKGNVICGKDLSKRNKSCLDHLLKGKRDLQSY